MLTSGGAFHEESCPSECRFVASTLYTKVPLKESYFLMMTWNEPNNNFDSPKFGAKFQNKTWTKYIHVAEGGCTAGTAERTMAFKRRSWWSSFLSWVNPNKYV